MEEFMAYLVKNIVTQPDAVNVSVTQDPQGAVVAVRVAEEDLARVVGRQGRTIKSLRTIAMTVGARFGARVRLELIQ